MNENLNQIIIELDDLYNELQEAAARGDVRPVDVAYALLETMKLIGRVAVAARG